MLAAAVDDSFPDELNDEKAVVVPAVVDDVPIPLVDGVVGAARRHGHGGRSLDVEGRHRRLHCCCWVARLLHFRGGRHSVANAGLDIACLNLLLSLSDTDPLSCISERKGRHTNPTLLLTHCSSLSLSPSFHFLFPVAVDGVGDGEPFNGRFLIFLTQ